jgi:hypothetical protein
MNAQRLHHRALTKEQWADPSDPVNNFKFQQNNTHLQETDWDQEASERAKSAGKWNERRRVTLEISTPLYLQAITEEAKNNFLTAGGTQERLDDIPQSSPGSPNSGTYKNKTAEPKTPRRTVSTPSWYSPTFHKNLKVVTCRIP